MPDTFVSLVGNLTDDPEVRFTPGGTQVGSFRLAVTPHVREGDTWKDGDTNFFRVNVWRELAAHTAESLSKGDRTLVIGRLRARSWETPGGSAAAWSRSRPRRSAPRSSGPPPPPSAPAARPATAPARAASSTTNHPSSSRPVRPGRS
jgi:single-strand DNA-binding protein